MLFTLPGILRNFAAAYCLPGTKASQVHTQSVTKATTSWTDKSTVNRSNTQKRKQKQQKAHKPYLMDSYYFTMGVHGGSVG
jgi:hypothetical protein